MKVGKIIGLRDLRNSKEIYVSWTIIGGENGTVLGVEPRFGDTTITFKALLGVVTIIFRVTTIRYREAFNIEKKDSTCSFISMIDTIDGEVVLGICA